MLIDNCVPEKRKSVMKTMATTRLGTIYCFFLSHLTFTKFHLIHRTPPFGLIYNTAEFYTRPYTEWCGIHFDAFVMCWTKSTNAFSLIIIIEFIFGSIVYWGWAFVRMRRLENINFPLDAKFPFGKCSINHSRERIQHLLFRQSKIQFNKTFLCYFAAIGRVWYSIFTLCPISTLERKHINRIAFNLWFSFVRSVCSMYSHFDLAQLSEHSLSLFLSVSLYLLFSLCRSNFDGTPPK